MTDSIAPTDQLDVLAAIERHVDGIHERLNEGDTMGALAGADWLAQYAEALRAGVVRQARHEGRSWATVAQALGVSRQAAHERYSGPDVA